MPNSDTDDQSEAVALRLARPSLEARDSNLWATLDAAQYAVLLIHEHPASDDEGEALDSFESVFAALVRGWEETSLGNKGPLIEAVAAKMASLVDFGLYVHWGIVQRQLEADGDEDAMTLPVAVLSIGRLADDDVTISVPRTIFAEPSGGEGDAEFE